MFRASFLFFIILSAHCTPSLRLGPPVDAVLPCIESFSSLSLSQAPFLLFSPQMPVFPKPLSLHSSPTAFLLPAPLHH